MGRVPRSSCRNRARYSSWKDCFYSCRGPERNFGEFEGEKIKFDEFWDYNVTQKYQKAETIQEIISRISNFLDKIKEEYKDKNILLVTHGGVSIAINCYFKGIPADGKLINYCLHNCEVQEFEN